MTNDTGIGCAMLCGECRASSAAAVDGCDVLKFVAGIIKEHGGELRQSMWPLGPAAKARLTVAFIDPVTFRILLGVAAGHRGIDFVDKQDRLEWRTVGMRGLMVYRYADLVTLEGAVLPEARCDFFDLLSLLSRPQSRVDAARILARRTLTPGAGIDVWNSRTGMLTHIGGTRPFFPETNR